MSAFGAVLDKELKWVGFARLAVVSNLSFLIAMLLTLAMDIDVVI